MGVPPWGWPFTRPCYSIGLFLLSSTCLLSALELLLQHGCGHGLTLVYGFFLHIVPVFGHLLLLSLLLYQIVERRHQIDLTDLFLPGHLTGLWPAYG